MASAGSPISPTKPKSQVYDGACHCGNIQFSVKISPPVEDGPVTSCNCSICNINGYLMVYPLETNITWHKGLDSMTHYAFGPKRVVHSFCPVCGTSIGGKSNDPNFFADNRAVNVRILKGVDVDSLKLRKVNGRGPSASEPPSNTAG
ncbi:hypothetical protein B0A52_08161 [Exophiala mesophila]|uniref:CENP-V/GFA domain-containing protein n=1 Tax=Exophiala mesophila TaxID=212818 RepID=A0A438MV46_EXOME|nr:hypothetical protein B0A52_08161 [Exophiala mesophila]